MYSRPTVPKSIGGVLDDIFKLYAAALPVCWSLSLTSALLVMAPNTYLQLQLRGDPTRAMAQFSSPTVWICYAAIMVVSVALSVSIMVRTLNVANGEDGSFASALSRGFGLFPRTCLASILFGLAVFVGIILLIVPGIFLMVAFMLSAPLIVAEDMSATASLSRSRQLIKGDWWRTCAIFSVALLVAYLLIICVGFISGVAGVLGGADRTFTLIISSIVGGLLNAFVLPLYSAVVLGIYFDLKLRKEGDDLADRVAALGKT